MNGFFHFSKLGFLNFNKRLWRLLLNLLSEYLRSAVLKEFDSWSSRISTIMDHFEVIQN